MVRIVIASGDGQQSIETTFKPCKRLYDWFWSQAFLWFSQLWFCLYQCSPTLIFVPSGCLSIVHCIRFTNLVQTSLYQWLWCGFDSSIKSFQICLIPIFLHMIWFYTNLMMIIAVIKAWNSQKIMCYQSFRFYMILFDLK